MEIKAEKNGNTLIITPSGKLNYENAEIFKEYITANIGKSWKLILDLKDVPYTSSAGLRVILSTHLLMRSRGGMTLINVQEFFMDSLILAGFDRSLNIE